MNIDKLKVEVQSIENDLSQDKSPPSPQVQPEASGLDLCQSNIIYEMVDEDTKRTAREGEFNLKDVGLQLDFMRKYSTSEIIRTRGYNSINLNTNPKQVNDN